jgi:hypothetical protein
MKSLHVFHCIDTVYRTGQQFMITKKTYDSVIIDKILLYMLFKLEFLPLFTSYIYLPTQSE